MSGMSNSEAVDSDVQEWMDKCVVLLAQRGSISCSTPGSHVVEISKASPLQVLMRLTDDALETYDAGERLAIAFDLMATKFEVDRNLTYHLTKRSIGARKKFAAAELYTFWGESDSYLSGCRDRDCVSCAEEGPGMVGLREAARRGDNISADEQVTIGNHEWQPDAALEKIEGRFKEEADRFEQDIEAERIRGLLDERGELRDERLKAWDGVNSRSTAEEQRVELTWWTIRSGQAVQRRDTTLTRHHASCNDRWCVGWPTLADARRPAFTSKEDVQGKAGCAYWHHTCDLPVEGTVAEKASTHQTSLGDMVPSGF